MRAKALLVLIGVGLAGCGGGMNDGSGPPADVPRGDTFSMLSQSQAASLCDYINKTNGGYGASMTCADGSVESNDDNQSACVSSAAPIGAACPTFTVGQAEDCATAVGLTLCNLETAAACAPFRDCLNTVAGTASQ
jgi:hypothetical protein